MKNQCEYCLNEFEEFDNVILVNDTLYHDYCVTLHPTGYVVFVGDEYIGDSENDEGESAYEYIDFEEDGD